MCQVVHKVKNCSSMNIVELPDDVIYEISLHLAVPDIRNLILSYPRFGRICDPLIQQRTNEHNSLIAKVLYWFCAMNRAGRRRDFAENLKALFKESINFISHATKFQTSDSPRITRFREAAIGKIEEAIEAKLIARNEIECYLAQI
ncbi:MAG: hypothetical protein ACYCOU_02880 [Sulfobacillus sp.]